MPAKKRVGGEGRRVEWPWSDRGRSALTAEDVRKSLEALAVFLPQVMCRVHGVRDRGPVVVNGEMWR